MNKFLVAILIFATITESRRVMPWICLEKCGRNVTEEIENTKQLAEAGVITGLSFEAYDVVWGGNLKEVGYTRVGETFSKYGIELIPMITTRNITIIRQLFENQNSFFDQVLTAANNYEVKLTGFNVDFEPENGDPPTADDAAKFAEFLTNFANKLHEGGYILTVDIASWSDFWDFDLLGKTTVDRTITMDTYCGKYETFLQRLDKVLAAVPLEHLGIGLMTTNPNNDQYLTDAELTERFASIKEHNINEVDLWSVPLPDNFIPYLKDFLSQ